MQQQPAYDWSMAFPRSVRTRPTRKCFFLNSFVSSAQWDLPSEVVECVMKELWLSVDLWKWVKNRRQYDGRPIQNAIRYTVVYNEPDRWRRTGRSTSEQGICDVRGIYGREIERDKVLVGTHDSNKVQLKTEILKIKRGLIYCPPRADEPAGTIAVVSRRMRTFWSWHLSCRFWWARKRSRDPSRWAGRAKRIPGTNSNDPPSDNKHVV